MTADGFDGFTGIGAASVVPELALKLQVPCVRFLGQDGGGMNTTISRTMRAHGPGEVYDMLEREAHPDLRTRRNTRPERFRNPLVAPRLSNGGGGQYVRLV